jgi:hypothetical protein
MAIDFNQPTLSALYTALYDYIRDNLRAIAKMNYSGGSNIQDGTIRWNSSSSKFEIYTASTTSWSDLANPHKFPSIETSGDATITGTLSIGSNENEVAPGGSLFGNNHHSAMSGTALDLSSIVPDGSGYVPTIGPTESGCDSIWSALDSIPSDVDYIIVRAFVQMTLSSATDLTAYIRASDYYGEDMLTTEMSDRDILFQRRIVSPSSTTLYIRDSTQFAIPVTTRKFNLYSSGTSGYTGDFDLYLIGYGYNK